MGGGLLQGSSYTLNATDAGAIDAGSGNGADRKAGITTPEAVARTLEATRIKMITAVRRYLHEPSMKHVDFYAGGVPKYRQELLKFAAYVARYGEPKWFAFPESR